VSRRGISSHVALLVVAARDVLEASELGGRFAVVVEQRLATLGLVPTSSRRKGSGRPGIVDSERFERRWGPVERWRFAAAFKQQMQRPHVEMGREGSD
jgi:hypothetical protein